MSIQFVYSSLFPRFLNYNNSFTNAIATFLRQNNEHLNLEKLKMFAK